MFGKDWFVIGILYESGEWSDYHLAALVAERGCPVKLIDAEHEQAEAEALACDMLVSRVFASAQFRGHGASLARFPQIARKAEERGIVCINAARAHAFEVSKRAAAEALRAAGLPAPRVFACATAGELLELFAGGGGAAGNAEVAGALRTAACGGEAVPRATACAGARGAAACEASPHNGMAPASVVLLEFPCVIKPDCGGRTTHTALVSSRAEAQSFLREVPHDVLMVVEEYARPAHGYLTRAEVVGGSCALVLKRSVAENGLSAYHLGSTYERYDNCPREERDVVERAAELLGIELGSFDVIEMSEGVSIVDVNSVSNASPDCEELFGMDFLAAHADYISAKLKEMRKGAGARGA